MAKRNISERIREYVVSRIESEAWPSGHRIPSEAEMMELFSASRMTVHRAVKELATEGHLVRERGRGTFVAKRIPRSDLLGIRDIAEEIAERGHTYFSEVRHLEREPASPLTMHLFGQDAGLIVARSSIVHYENSVPLQLEERWVDLAVVPGYIEADFSKVTPSRYLMQEAPLQKVEHELTAVLPTVEQQIFLKVKADDPCLLLKRKTWSGDRLVSYAELLYPASRYSFGGTFSPTN